MCSWVGVDFHGVNVFLDGTKVFNRGGTLDTRFGGFGFAGRDGEAVAEQSIGNVKVTRAGSGQEERDFAFRKENLLFIGKVDKPKATPASPADNTRYPAFDKDNKDELVLTPDQQLGVAGAVLLEEGVITL